MLRKTTTVHVGHNKDLYNALFSLFSGLCEMCRFHCKKERVKNVNHLQFPVKRSYHVLIVYPMQKTKIKRVHKWFSLNFRSFPNQ